MAGTDDSATRATSQQLRQWTEEGYVVIQGFEGEDLLRLQLVFDRCAADAKEAWLEGVEDGSRPAAHFDVPLAHEKDTMFAELGTYPSYHGLVRDFLGEDAIYQGAGVRTLPPSPISYVGWHPDVKHDRPQHMKIQIYVEDVSADGGAFAFVPGSHTPDTGWPPVYDQLEEMPGHIVLPGRAGTAILFNNYGWHTSMVNSTPHARKSIILSYRVAEQGGDRR